MSSGLLEQVRVACKKVAESARYVRIDSDRLKIYASSLPVEQIRSPELDARYHYLGDPDDTVAYILTLDSINFGSGYFPHIRKRAGLSGYLTIASSLKWRFEAKGPFTAQELSSLSALDCAKIFGQELDDGPQGELMRLFARALNDLGRYLLERFEGRFVGLVQAAASSAERLVAHLAEMPYFKDVHCYHGLEVPFYKRAQLTVADLSLAFKGQGYGSFKDLDRLTVFADNLVPHVLRVDGVLSYDDSLERRIDSGELIPSGSDEEIEIRASAVHAVELMVEQLRSAGHDVTAMQLDHLLWNRGQEPRYKARPRHRTRTVFY